MLTLSLQKIATTKPIFCTFFLDFFFSDVGSFVESSHSSLIVECTFRSVSLRMDNEEEDEDEKDNDKEDEMEDNEDEEWKEEF